MKYWPQFGWWRSWISIVAVLCSVGCARRVPQPKLTIRQCAEGYCPGPARLPSGEIARVCYRIEPGCAKARQAPNSPEFCNFVDGCPIVRTAEVLMPGEGLDADPDDDVKPDKGKHDKD